MSAAAQSIGSRNAFSQAFIGDLAASWAQNGPKILAHVAKVDPVRYLGVAASLIPRDVAVSIEARLPGQLSPEDWDLIMQVLEAVKLRSLAAHPRCTARVRRQSDRTKHVCCHCVAKHAQRQ
jgi:hypothetical protein